MQIQDVWNGFQKSKKDLGVININELKVLEFITRNFYYKTPLELA